MALGAEALAAKIEALGRSMQCPVCLSVMREPARTKCSHYACHSCIRRALQNTSRCPQCNKICKVRELQLDYQLAQMCVIYAEIEACQEKELLCSQLPILSPSSSYGLSPSTLKESSREYSNLDEHENPGSVTKSGRAALREIKDDNTSCKDNGARKTAGKKNSESSGQQVQNLDCSPGTGLNDKEHPRLLLFVEGSGNQDVQNDPSPENSLKNGHLIREKSDCEDQNRPYANGQTPQFTEYEGEKTISNPLFHEGDGSRSVPHSKPTVDPPYSTGFGDANSEKGSDSDRHYNTIFDNIDFAIQSDSAEVNLSDPKLNNENIVAVRTQDPVDTPPQIANGNSSNYVRTADGEEGKPIGDSRSLDTIFKPLASLQAKFASYFNDENDTTKAIQLLAAKRSKGVEDTTKGHTDILSRDCKRNPTRNSRNRVPARYEGSEVKEKSTSPKASMSLPVKREESKLRPKVGLQKTEPAPRALRRVRGTNQSYSKLSFEDQLRLAQRLSLRSADPFCRTYSDIEDSETLANSPPETDSGKIVVGNCSTVKREPIQKRTIRRTGKSTRVVSEAFENGEQARKRKKSPLPRQNRVRNVRTAQPQVQKAPSSIRCAFCHKGHDPSLGGWIMVAGLDPGKRGRTNGAEAAVHHSCAEWAPKVYYDKDRLIGISDEVRRASKLPCSVCYKRGAAIGCAVPACRKSYHFGCASEDGCLFDKGSFTVLCPLHIPTEKAATADRARRDCSSTYARAKNKEVIVVGSNLSTDQRALVESLAKIAKVKYQKQWCPKVTHVVCSANSNRLVKRTLKYAAASLSGKWVLDIGWVSQSVIARRLLPEEPFEILGDDKGGRNGPSRRRLAMAPLIKNFRVALYGTFVSTTRAQVEMLVAAAGGKILSLSFIREIGWNRADPKAEANSIADSVFVLADGDHFERCSQVEGIKFPILSYMWLLECASQGRVVDYAPFRVRD